jgi:hypothetical protein
LPLFSSPVLTWKESPAEVEARLMLGSSPEAMPGRFRAARDLLARGFKEIGNFFRARESAWVQEYWG